MIIVDENFDGEMFAAMKKPIPVRAVQMQEPFSCKTLLGPQKGQAGDYLMQGNDGEYYPCPNEVFEATYDFVDFEHEEETHG